MGIRSTLIALGTATALLGAGPATAKEAEVIQDTRGAEGQSDSPMPEGLLVPVAEGRERLGLLDTSSGDEREEAAQEAEATLNVHFPEDADPELVTLFTPEKLAALQAAFNTFRRKINLQGATIHPRTSGRTHWLIVTGVAGGSGPIFSLGGSEVPYNQALDLFIAQIEERAALEAAARDLEEGINLNINFPEDADPELVALFTPKRLAALKAKFSVYKDGISLQGATIHPLTGRRQHWLTVKEAGTDQEIRFSLGGAHWQYSDGLDLFIRQMPRRKEAQSTPEPIPDINVVFSERTEPELIEAFDQKMLRALQRRLGENLEGAEISGGPDGYILYLNITPQGGERLHYQPPFDGNYRRSLEAIADGRVRRRGERR